MAQGSPAAEALRLLSTGCYSVASLDGVFAEAEGECVYPDVVRRIAAARMRCRIHEQSLVGIIHGSEEYDAWLAERKQVRHEIRAALIDALSSATGDDAGVMS